MPISEQTLKLLLAISTSDMAQASSIRKITSNAALAAHGSDNYRKYVNADGSLTPAAHDLNTKFRLDNPHEPAGRGHPIVGGAMYQHENTAHIAKVRAVIQKEQK